MARYTYPIALPKQLRQKKKTLPTPEKPACALLYKADVRKALPSQLIWNVRTPYTKGREWRENRGEAVNPAPGLCAALWRVGGAAYAVTWPRCFGALLRVLGGSVNRWRAAEYFSLPLPLAMASIRARNARIVAYRPP